VLTRRGREVAHLVPPPPPARRVFGQDAGVFTVPDDFDEPLPEEILREFEG
jgi:antitoxin (DNA-binding transcriptional repressor) of toxin-antitoxin stability system